MMDKLCLWLILLCVWPSEALVAAAQPLPVEETHAVFVSGGCRIHVDVYAPANARRYPAVLVLHTAAGTLLGKGALENFARRIAEQGAVTFFVHYFDRTGTFFAGDEAISRLSPVWLATIHDAVDFAASYPRTDPGALGIFGYSLGAFLAVAESARDIRVKAIVEVAGGIFHHYEPQMQRMPALLILHGSADQRVPKACADELAAKARHLGIKPTMKIYPGEGHLLSPAAMKDAAQRTLEFFRIHLLSLHGCAATSHGANPTRCARARSAE